MSILTNILIAAVLTGCLTSWVVILLKKWGVTEWVQVHGNSFFGKLASCDFCMNWWSAWVIVAVALIATGWWWLVGVPFFSTAIGRFLSA